LKCGQRDKGETTLGLKDFDNPNNTAGNGDYCYDPDYIKKSKLDRTAAFTTINALSSGSTPCTNEIIGTDPLPGVAKLCYCQTPVAMYVQPAKKSCDLKADIVIVVDESGSVG
jgi:hypothetical protein